MNDYRSGNVFVNGRPAGIIQETESGYQFCYHSFYLAQPGATPVSLTLPLRPEAYCSQTLFPFFDGLIPEGWLLELALNHWKLNRRDRFGLLLIACRDCIGNVIIEEAESK